MVRSIREGGGRDRNGAKEGSVPSAEFALRSRTFLNPRTALSVLSYLYLGYLTSTLRSRTSHTRALTPRRD